MVKRSKRLRLVADLALQHKQQADKLLGEAQSRCDQDEQTLQQIEDYLSEYQHQFIQAGQGGMNIAQLQSQQAFIAKLRNTLEAHKRAMQMHKDHLEQVRLHWQKAYSRYKGLSSLSEQALEREQQQLEKQEQKLIDERAQYSHSGGI